MICICLWVMVLLKDGRQAVDMIWAFWSLPVAERTAIRLHNNAIELETVTKFRRGMAVAAQCVRVAVAVALGGVASSGVPRRADGERRRRASMVCDARVCRSAASIWHGRSSQGS